MNVFEKRPLCLILCIGLGGFFLFTLDIWLLRVSLIIVAILLGFLSVILRIDKYKKAIILFSSIIILISSIFSFVYFDLFFKIYDRYDEPVEIVGVVEEVSELSSYTTRLLIKTERIDGKARKYKLYAYPTKKEATGIIENTRISFTATPGGFSDESRFYNFAKGINAYANDTENITILEYTNGGLPGVLKHLKEYLARYTISLSNKDTGAILSALLLGERDYLPDQLRLDFKRTGISHILALSGMHLAILSVGIGKALSLLKVKKKPRVAITALFVFLYMALTGFSVSVVRSGIMLILSSVLFLLSRSKDSLTSLSVAVWVICLFTPHAIFDISLWLSALATFGIIVFGEISVNFEKPKNIKDKIKRYIIVAILASVFAISSTIAISAISFGGISILAPITTIIFSILAEIIMYLGCLMLLIGWLIPIGWLISPLCFVMSYLAGVFSSIKFAYISSVFSFVTVVIIIYTVVFYLLMIVKLKNQKPALIIITACYLFVTVLPTIGTVRENYRETVAYSGTYKCDELLIRSENEVCLINSSQYSKNLVYDTLDFLEETKVTYVDKYYLTHYSWSLDEDIETLLYNVLVDKIYLPAPRNEDEETILKILYKSVEDHRTEIVTFQEYETVHTGEYTINLLYSTPYGDTSMNALAIAKDNEIYTYISSGLLTGKSRDTFESYISLTDHLILGDHGKKYKEKIYLEECYENIDSIIIHSENLFLKQENMQYYIDKGCSILSHPKNIVYLFSK